MKRILLLTAFVLITSCAHAPERGAIPMPSKPDRVCIEDCRSGDCHLICLPCTTCDVAEANRLFMEYYVVRELNELTGGDYSGE